MTKTYVKQVMNPNPSFIDPERTLMEAAQMMESIDCGILPVGTKDNLEGVITDRDIVVRAIAKGKSVAEEKVRDYMTTDIRYCSEEDSLEQAGDNMCEYQVNRLMVKDRGGKLSGLVTFGCILRKDNDSEEIAKIVDCALGRKAA